MELYLSESHSSLSSKSEIDRVRQLEEKNRKLQKENRELQRKLNESQLSEMSYIQQLNELQLAYTKIKHKIKLKVELVICLFACTVYIRINTSMCILVITKPQVIFKRDNNE